MQQGLKTMILAALMIVPQTAVAQSVMSGVDMTLPKMTQALKTRAEVKAILAAATKDAPADFTRAWLNGLDLSGLDFSGAILRAAALNTANLAGANFDGANLSQAWMIGVDLTGASLRGAQLFQTQLGQANLTDADFSGARAAADFTRATLNGAIFRGADFSADMRNQSMGLMRGVLRSARGQGTDFSGARMNRADLEFAKLPGAKFTGADLSMTTLGGADFSGADITGADFSQADVTSTRFTGAIGAEQSTLRDAKNLERATR